MVNVNNNNQYKWSWKSDFLQAVKSRNSRETDCFIDLFSSCNLEKKQIKYIDVENMYKRADQDFVTDVMAKKRKNCVLHFFRRNSVRKSSSILREPRKIRDQLSI